MNNHNKTAWEAYYTKELTTVGRILSRLGFSLEKEQPHLIGERYVLSGKKFVLLGRRDSDGKRVVIKCTNEKEHSIALQKERACREVLYTMRFAYHIFQTPREIFFQESEGYTFYCTEYIPQTCTFLERPLEEQFFLALKAFEAQESSHGTTHEHIHLMRKYFEVYNEDTYLQKMAFYEKTCIEKLPHEHRLHRILAQAQNILAKEKTILARYTNFLTHWDFVPHNFRVQNDEIYLLDHTALRFGNKYEGWARFLNFMLLYNKPLEEALSTYIQRNRHPDEYQSLLLMRIFRATELVWFYTNTLARAEGDLHTLEEARIQFWREVLEAHIKHIPVSDACIATYKKTRDALRDTEEQKRQQGLH